MLLELKELIDADESWAMQPLTSEDRFVEVRNSLEDFLGGGEKTKYGLVGRILNLGEAGNTWREIDVEVGGDKCHLAVRSRSLDYSEGDIFVTLFSENHEKSAQVTIPGMGDFESDNSSIDIPSLLRNITLMERDVVPLLKKQVEEDRKKNPPGQS